MQTAALALTAFFLRGLLIAWLAAGNSAGVYAEGAIGAGCLLGLGFGLAREDRRIEWLRMWAALLFLAGFKMVPARFGDPPAIALLITILGAGIAFYVMIPLGQLIVKGGFRPLLLVLGGTLGIFLFGIVRILEQPPAVWLLFAAVLLALSSRHWLACLALLICAATSLYQPGSERVIWSRYDRLTLSPGELATGETSRRELDNMSVYFARAHPELFAGKPTEWNRYNLPMQIARPPGGVLLLGDTSGNEAAAALRYGSSQVTVVEKDAAVSRLIRGAHPEVPYLSKRVEVVTDDPQHFLLTTSRSFDLILIAVERESDRLHPLLNLEAMESAKARLTHEGLLMIASRGSIGKGDALVRALLPETAPLRLATSDGGTVEITGSSGRIQFLLRYPEIASYVATNPAQLIADSTWRWVNLLGPIVLLLVALAGWLTLRRSGSARLLMSFFFGAGFLLTQAHITARMRVVSASTPLTDAVLFAIEAGLLLLAFRQAEETPTFAGRFVYPVLAGAIVLAYLATFTSQPTTLLPFAALLPLVGAALLGATLLGGRVGDAKAWAAAIGGASFAELVKIGSAGMETRWLLVDALVLSGLCYLAQRYNKVSFHADVLHRDLRLPDERA